MQDASISFTIVIRLCFTALFVIESERFHQLHCRVRRAPANQRSSTRDTKCEQLTSVAHRPAANLRLAELELPEISALVQGAKADRTREPTTNRQLRKITLANAFSTSSPSSCGNVSAAPRPASLIMFRIAWPTSQSRAPVSTHYRLLCQFCCRVAALGCLIGERFSRCFWFGTETPSGHPHD